LHQNHLNKDFKCSNLINFGIVKLVLPFDLERYGIPSLEANHPQNLHDRKYVLSGLELILKIHKKYKVSGTVFVLCKLLCNK